jgi:hypothetical protein
MLSDLRSRFPLPSATSGVLVGPPAPLSLSSSGLVGQSDRERGGLVVLASCPPRPADGVPSLSGLHRGRRPGSDLARAPPIILFVVQDLCPRLGFPKSPFELIVVARKGVRLLLVAWIRGGGFASSPAAPFHRPQWSGLEMASLVAVKINM